MKTNSTYLPSWRSAAAAAIAVTVLGSASACGDDSPPASSSKKSTQTTTKLEFRLSETDSESNAFDVGEKGDSVGDRNVNAVTLELDGKVAGRMQGVCTTLDNAYEGHLCELAIIIEGGSLTLASGGVGKPIAEVDGRGDIFAVTGGTGDYLGATGEMTVGEDGRTVKITLRRS